MIRDRTKGIGFLCATPAFAGILAGSAVAQQQQAAGSSEAGQLSEIVVTAEKREATVQNTPLSLTAISGADLQARGATDLSSLLTSVPGVSIRTSGPGLTEYEMRGLSSTGGNSPTVGFYYDDTLVTATANTNEGKVTISPSLYDVSRIEVLRGPQGTLYGSGSMGGTIKFVPNAPEPGNFASSVEAVFSDTSAGGFNQSENAMVNLPIGGVAAVRIVASYEDDAGWIDRIVAQPGTFPLATATGARGNVAAAPVATDYKNVNDTQRTTVRISGLLEPIEGLSITPAFFYQKLTSGGLPYIDGVPGTDAHYQPFDVPESINDVFRLGSLKLAYKTDLFEIDSNSAYWSRFEPVVQDTAESWTLGLGLPTYAANLANPAAGGLGPNEAIEDNYSHQTSEELRVSSVGDSAFKWLVGYFYQDFVSTLDIYYPVTADPFLPGDNNFFSYQNPTKILQQSIFGQATYNITSALAFTAGARRYYYNESTVAVQNGGLVGGTPSVTSVGDRDQGVTPKFSLSYTFSPDLLVYTTAAKGFRPGGGTGPVPTSGPATCETQLQQEYGSGGAFVQGPDSFNPDRVWSYELGEKWRGAENRLSVNASVYFESWSGVQQTNALSSCGYTYTANAGNAHIYGGELEIRALVTDELTATVNTGYAHAALVSVSLIDSVFSPGTELQDDPKWTGSASLAYRHQVTSDYAITARADNQFVGSRIDATYGINTLPSYDLTNLRAGVEAKNWSAVLFINNVTNKRALLSDITQDAENLSAYNRIAVNQPLTAGIDLNYRFGN